MHDAFDVTKQAIESDEKKIFNSLWRSVEYLSFLNSQNCRNASTENSPPSTQGSILSWQAKLTPGDHHARVTLSRTWTPVRLERAQMCGITIVQYCRQGLMLFGRFADDEDLTRFEVYRRVYTNVLLAAVRLMNYHSVLLSITSS